MSERRMYMAVAAAAILVYVRALWNQWAMDDLYAIVNHPVVQEQPPWQAFAYPYWPVQLGGFLYRPLVIASFALDRAIDGPAWFHAVNVLWHAAASLAVAILAHRWAGVWAGLAAGVIFAVHPVHVEPVANAVGRSELMAAGFALLAVYAAVERRSVTWSAVAGLAGLLCKENAVVVPGLIVWAWMLGIGRPTRRQALAFAASWVVVGAGYAVLRHVVLAPYGEMAYIAPVFAGESPVAIRLTAVATLRDVARVLLLPVTLRVDYSPDERTIVASALDPRFLAGLACFLGWGVLLALAWRRGRRVEAWGLGAIGIAFLPVANLLFPVGTLFNERLLYLPSAGLVVTAGAALARLQPRRLVAVLGVLAALGGVRAWPYIPAWGSDDRATLNILETSPRSFRGFARMGAVYLKTDRPGRALDAFRTAIEIFPHDGALYLSGAYAAFEAGRPATADSLLREMERVCPRSRCAGLYRFEAANARLIGDTTAADSLLARLDATWEQR